MMLDQSRLRSTEPSSYLLALLLIFAATLTSVILLWLIGPRTISWPFVVALVLIGSRYGRKPAVLASFAAFLAYNFFLVNPRFRLSLAPADFVEMGNYLDAAFIDGTMD